MKIILWSLFGITFLVWTAAAALFGQILEWSIGLLSSGGVTALRDAALNLPIPEWLAPWLAFGDWQALAQWTATVMQSLSGLLPLTGELLSWVIPAVWIVWGLGAVLMLLLTSLASRFIPS